MVIEAGKTKVLPFSSLVCKFNYYWGPEIENTFPYTFKGVQLIDAPYFQGLTNPLSIVEGWRFYSIWMADAREQTHIRVIKDLVANVREDQYTITSVTAGLNPRDWDGGCSYTSGTDYGAHLFVRDGVITIRGVDINKVDAPIKKIGVREVQKQLASGLHV